MYRNFFGFSARPFELTPDSRFLYLSHELKEVFATLRYGIIQRHGFILVVGEPGTGKTTLLNALIDHSGTDSSFAFIFNPDLSFNELLRTILIEFDLASVDEELSKTQAIHRLKLFVNAQYEKGRNTVIVVDEAQCLDIKTLEKLRLLSNLETHKHKLLQIILCGQPELENTLSHRKLTQLAQRMSLRCRTQPLNKKDAYEYIDHRLKIAEYQGENLFSDKAKHLIWTHSKGIPRIINIICDNSLLYGYSAGQKRIDSFMVKEVIDDLNEVPLESADYTLDQSKDAIMEIPETSPIESEEISDVAAESLEKKEDDNSSIIERLRKKLSRHQNLEIFVKKEKKFRTTLIAAIVGVAIIINIFILFFFIESFRDFKSEFASELEGMKNHFQYQLGGIENSINKARSDNNFNMNKNLRVNGTAIKKDDKEVNKVVVKKGESLYGIILRTYGKNNPEILDAVLKMNPEIKNPDLIVENQIVKLPKKLDFK